MSSLKVQARRTAGCILLWSLILSLPVTAQDPRGDLLTRARAALFDFDVGGALTSLQTAVDPTLGPADMIFLHHPGKPALNMPGQNQREDENDGDVNSPRRG